jgi:hypothetical protein
MTRRGGVFLCVVAALASGGVGAALPATQRGVDWSLLTPDDQRLVRPVIATSQIAREVDDIVYPTRREIWEYLLDHPDFAADVARILREGKYRIRRVADHYEAEDGRGVRAVMRPLYAANGLRVFYLEGSFDSKWLPTLYGRAILVLDSDYIRSQTGTPLASVALNGHLRIDNALFGALMVLARDFSEKTFDRRVRRFFRHVERVNRRATEDPEGLVALLAASRDVNRQRLAEFRRILLPPRRSSPEPYAYLTVQPYARVTGVFTGRPASTACSAART